MIDDVLQTPLKIIEDHRGSILQVMKHSDAGYKGFGEAYFSTVNSGMVKAWKKHSLMTLNLVVPVGYLRFVLHDEKIFREFFLSPMKTYERLTIPPGLWFGFQAIGPETAVLLNLADIKHDPYEAEARDVNFFNFDWEFKK